MAIWATTSAATVAIERRWDAEFFVNPYNDYLTHTFALWKDWVSLSDASAKLTSGHTPLRHDVSEGDTPFITVECVDPLALILEKSKRVWAHHVAGELSRVRVKRGDVLITIKRRIALACPILDEPGVMAVNQDVAVMTPKSGLRPGYIAAVLNSRIGQFQALRHATEQMNPYINVTTLGRVLIPRVPQRVQVAVEKVVEERLRLLRQGVDGYREAEALLLDRLGWTVLEKRPRELTYSTSFSTLAAAGRIDAECFHPCSKRVRGFLIREKALPVEDVCDFVEHGLQPTYIEAGNVGIVSQRQFRASGLDLASLENFTDEAFCDANPAFRLRKGDVLTYCVSAGEYLGRTFLFNSSIPCVAASFVTILRTTKLVPGYLALFLNSPFGLIQTNAVKRGTSPFYLYPRDFRKLLVYVPRTKGGQIDHAWQEELAAKVETAERAREEAQAKLAEAKRLVEKALST
jgi:hypothetical protein